MGKAVFKKLTAFGLSCVAVDPFLQARGEREQNNDPLVSLEAALASDVVCLHTPLTKEGLHPTYLVHFHTNAFKSQQ